MAEPVSLCWSNSADEVSEREHTPWYNEITQRPGGRLRMPWA